MSGGEVQRASVSGAAMAALMHSIAAAEEDFDGLILGSVISRTTSTLQDSEELQTEVVAEAFVSAFFRNATMGSFYSADGTIDVQLLLELAAPLDAPLLGWFAFRRGLAARLTLRERMVCNAWPAAASSVAAARLAAAGLNSGSSSAGAAGVPALFLLLSDSTEHGGATLSLDYRLFQQSQAGRLAPLQLTISNLGAAFGQQRTYEQLAPVPSLPSVPAFLPDRRTAPSSADVTNHSRERPSGAAAAGPSGRGQAQASGPGAGEPQAEMLEHLVTVGLRQQVVGLEEVYQTLQQQAQALAAEVADAQALVAARRAALVHESRP